MDLHRFIKPAYVMIILIGSGMGLSSCQEDEVVFSGNPSQISFATHQCTATEGSGLQQVTIRMDEPQDSDTFVHFRISTNAEQFVAGHAGADFELLTESPVRIPAGAQEALIELQLREDEVFEYEAEQIEFQLEAVLSGHAEIAAGQNTHLLQIQENDYELSLGWTAEEGKSVPDISFFVELPNYHLFSSREEGDGEKLILTNVHDKQEYLIDVVYEDGEAPADYELHFLKAGAENAELLVNGRFGENTGSMGQQRPMIQHYRLFKRGDKLSILQ
jgi:hypothetical protein